MPRARIPANGARKDMHKKSSLFFRVACGQPHSPHCLRRLGRSFYAGRLRVIAPFRQTLGAQHSGVCLQGVFAWWPMKDQIREKQGNKCFYCKIKMCLPPRGRQNGRYGTLYRHMETVDHLVPKKNGGKNQGNCVLACNECNNKKGRLSSFEFLGLRFMRFMFQDAASKKKRKFKQGQRLTRK